MEVLIIYILVAAALFVSAFIARRRFGLLGLALATGSILSNIWGFDADLVASVVGIKTTPLSSAIVLSLITLLPAAVLLFHGYTYKTFIGRVVGASLFTMLSLAFLVEPLGHVMNLGGFGGSIYTWLVNNREAIVGIGLIVAIVDLFLTKPAKSRERGRPR